MSNQKYRAEDFASIDPLFHQMSVKAIAELDWVPMSEHTLHVRRKSLGIPPSLFQPAREKKPKPLTTREIDGYIRHMGGVHV